MRAKSQYSCNYIQGLIEKCTVESPESFTRAMVQHCIETTSHSREFMEANPDKAEPKDYKEFPGKMDHTTCISVIVDDYENEDNLVKKKKLSKVKKGNRKQSGKSTKRKKEKMNIDWNKVSEEAQSLVSNVQLRVVEEGVTSDVLQKIYGPAKEKLEKVESLCAGWTMSTYPFQELSVTEMKALSQSKKDKLVKKGKIRDKDPIVQFYGMEMMIDFFVAVVTTSLDYGPKYKESAMFVRDHFIEIMKKERIGNLHSAITQCIEAVHSCDKELIAKEDSENLDAVSLIGGMVAPLRSLDSTQKWVFISIAVGNCKAFRWNNKRGSVTDISFENQIDDPSFVGKGHLVGLMKNVHLYLSEFEDKDDIIILMTPLVYENLDPFYLGIKPKDLNIQQKSWFKGLEKERSKFWCERIEKLIKDSGEIEVENIVKALMDNAMDISESRRNNPEIQNKQFDDETGYQRYPGKLGHATCIAFKAGF